MKLRKMLALLLSIILISTCCSLSSSAYAQDEAVVVLTDSSGKVNRYVYYPSELDASDKKYPVIVWANGTGCKASLYNDLLKGFAEQGFVVIASDETMSADGKDQISNLDYALNRAKKSGDVLFNRIYADKITAMGHSQGGRSAVNAGSADKRFCCVVSIAGSNYQEEAELLKAPALFLTGTNDNMVSSSKWVKPAYNVCKGPAVYASLIGAKHTACCNEPYKYIGYCISWIKAWIDNDFTALSVFKDGGAFSQDTDWVDYQCKNLTNNISGTASLSATKYTYDGKVKKPTVSVKDYRGTKISKDDYSIFYANGRKNVGKYKVTIKYRNNYSGSKNLYFTILPKGVELNKLTASKGGFTVKWSKRTTQVTGYQLQYSTNSKFTNAKSLTITKNTTTSKSFSKLSKGKKYYVRIRTYKIADGKKYYSSWSKSKAVTTKK